MPIGWLLSSGTSPILEGMVNVYADLPLASLHSDKAWYVKTGSGGFLAIIGAYKYPKGIYISDGFTWTLLQIQVQISEDALTLVNIDDWLDFLDTTPIINIYDVLIYNNVMYKNITGVTISTAPNIDTTNWVAILHVPVTLGTSSGLGLLGQQLSLGLASSGVTGALSGADWNTFNAKEPSIGFKNTAFNKNYGTDALDVKINGTQGVGIVDAIARIDHVHPVDTSREAALGNPSVNGYALVSTTIGVRSWAFFTADHGALSNRDIAGNHAKIFPSSDSITAFQFLKADGVTPIMNIDSINLFSRFNNSVNIGDTIKTAGGVFEVSKIVIVSPIMASNTAPSPYVISALNQFSATYAAWRALDGFTTLDRYWLGTTPINWWKIDYSYPVIAVNKYILKPGTYAQYLPKTWTFEGSNDNLAWTVLDTQTNIVFVNNIDQTFIFTNLTKYRYYRVNITASNDVAYVVIPEIEFYGNQTSFFTNTSGNVSIGSSVPSAKFSIDSIGGAATGFALNLTNPNSYTSIDFNTPSGGTPYGLAGQFGLTGVGFISGNASRPDSVILSNYLTNGSIAFISSGANGIIEFVTGGLTTSSRRARFDSAGNFLIVRDDTKIKMGAGDDFSLGYDGTNANIKTDEVAPSDLKLTCGANKTLELQNVVYEDIQFPISSGRTAAVNAPDWEAFTTNTSAFSFDVNDFIDLGAGEPAHGWVEGSMLDWHLHVTLKAANTSGANRYAKFTLYVAYCNTIGAVWTEPTPVTAELTIPNGTAALTQFFLDLGDTTPTGYKIGSQIKCRVKRIAATSGTEYASHIFITQVGAHHQINTMGSRSESAK